MWGRRRAGPAAETRKATRRPWGSAATSGPGREDRRAATAGGPWPAGSCVRGLRFCPWENDSVVLTERHRRSHRTTPSFSQNDTVVLTERRCRSFPQDESALLTGQQRPSHRTTAGRPLPSPVASRSGWRLSPHAPTSVYSSHAPTSVYSPHAPTSVYSPHAPTSVYSPHTPTSVYSPHAPTSVYSAPASPTRPQHDPPKRITPRPSPAASSCSNRRSHWTSPATAAAAARAPRPGLTRLSPTSPSHDDSDTGIRGYLGV